MSILKILIVILITIGIVGGGIYLTSAKKEGLVLKTQIKINGTVGKDWAYATIENITGHFEPVSRAAVPMGNNLINPGVVVVLIDNERMIGLWTSVPYHGTGVYNLTVGIHGKINPGDLVLINARVIDQKGENIEIENAKIIYNQTNNSEVIYHQQYQ